MVTKRDAPRSRRIIERDHDDQAAPMERAGDESTQCAEMHDSEAGERDPAWVASVRGFHWTLSIREPRPRSCIKRDCYAGSGAAEEKRGSTTDSREPS